MSYPHINSKKNRETSKLTKKEQEQITIMLGIIVLSVVIALVYFLSPTIEVFEIVYNSSETYKLSQLGKFVFDYDNTFFAFITLASIIGTVALVVLIFIEQPFENSIQKLYGICGVSAVSILSVVIPLFIIKGKAKDLTSTAVRFTSAGTFFIILNIIAIFIALLIIDKLKEKA